MQTQRPTTDPADANAPAAAPDRAVRRSVRIPHAPGLDGLRGLAVLAVLVFHAGPIGWLPGGFLGVSLFFTLSGYLITSLVLAEVRRDRTLALAAFWARRMRRLLPALLLTIAGVMVMSWLVDLRRGIHDDLIGGLTYSANWVQIIKGQSYGDLFLAPSPLVHLWSLAIEEQFYLIMPVASWLLARRAPWEVRTKLALGAGLVIAVGLGASILTHDPTVGYYSTLHRAPEIAIGVLLACLTRVSTNRAPTWQTVAALVAVVLAAATCHLGHVTDAWVTSGGLVAFALLSATMVRVAARPGPFATGLSVAPLRWLGLISYGLYLYHWPIVVLLDRPRVDWAPVPLFFARTALSLAVAAVSYRFVELPVRHGGRSIDDRSVVIAGLVALVTAVAIVMVVVPPDGDATPKAVPAPAVVDPAKRPPAKPSEPAGPPVVALIGDSVPAWMIRDGGSGLDPKQVQLINATLAACDGAEGTPDARSRTGAIVPVPEGCTGWKTQYPPYFASPVDVAMLMVGPHAALDRKIEGEFRGPCDPVNKGWYRRDIDQRLAYLDQHADKVVVVLPAWADDKSAWIFPPDHRQRIDCVRAVLKQAAEDHGAAIVDFGSYVCPDGSTLCRPLRQKDGMHLDPPNAPAALRWVVQQGLAAKATS